MAAVEDVRQVGGEVGVAVEPQDGIRLGQLGGQPLAVPLRQAPHGHHRSGPAARFEIRGLQDGVDRVLLGRLDEAAGVDDRDVGGRRVVGHLPSLRRQAPGQLFGVDLVAGAAQGDQRHRTARRDLLRR
jgi:hypothetical protein